jgi:hypothetical protein
MSLACAHLRYAGSPSVKDELEALAPHLNFVSISSFDRSSLEQSIHHCAKKVSAFST